MFKVPKVSPPSPNPSPQKQAFHLDRKGKEVFFNSPPPLFSLSNGLRQFFLTFTELCTSLGEPVGFCVSLLLTAVSRGLPSAPALQLQGPENPP